MRRRKSVEPRFFVGIAAVAVLCILSAVYSGVTGNPSPVSRAAGAVIRPVQRLASGIGGVFGRGIGYFTEFDELKAENEELKKQLRENEQLVRDAQLAIEENNRFRAQAGQPERQRNLTTVNAEVISRNPGDTAVTLTLDKGTAHGVAKGDLVTTIDGMVGYVSEAGSNTCEVTTVTDVDMQCGALITRTRETAIAEGSYDLMSEDRLRLSYLTAGNQVVVGDTEPKFQGTVSTNLYYKGFSLYLLGTFKCGGYVYNTTRATRVEGTSGKTNVDHRAFNDRWQEVGDIALYRRITDHTIANYTDRFVEKENVFTLTSVNLGYEFPATICKKLMVRNLRLGVNLTDILRFSSVKIERGTTYLYGNGFEFTLSTTF